MKHCLQLCGIAVVSSILITILISITLSYTITSGESPEVNKNNYKRIFHLSSETQDEWEEALLHSPIERIVNEGYVGLATKYLVVFESGHLAIAKLVEPFSLVSHDWETITYEDTGRYEAKSNSYYSRSGRKFQAWTEVAAYIVSRIAIPIAKKPPAVIREISSSLLYQCDGCNSWSDYFKSWLPEHSVYISCHAYLNDMRISAPSTDIMEYLTHTPTPHDFASRKRETTDSAKYVSDVIVFDYILDDHDRKRDHNWMLDGDEHLLLWDSGLCFQHGPIGKSSCLNLLCGPEKWQEHGKNVYKKKSCERICRFRRETIEKLQSLSPQNNMDTPELSLGNRVKKKTESMEAPIFEWNLYYQFGQGYPKVKFQNNDFFSGLDVKLTKFLEHFEDCKQKYGPEVFVP